MKTSYLLLSNKKGKQPNFEKYRQKTWTDTSQRKTHKWPISTFLQKALDTLVNMETQIKAIMKYSHS